MTDWTALKTKWATLTGTVAQNLAAINALSVPGPAIDVPASQVVRYLSVKGKLAGLLKYAASPPAIEAGLAAAELAAVLAMGGNAPPFYMSQAADNAAISAMLSALAADAASGVALDDVTALLALSTPPIPWWQANGYPAPFNGHDLVAAGIAVLTTSAPTTPGSAVLNFASVPSWVVAGMEVHDLGLDQADIPIGSIVQSMTATTVTMSRPCTGSGIASGDTIGFASV